MNAISGLQLKVLSIRAGLRQYELAAQLGITQTKLSEIECGRTYPSTELLQWILDIIHGCAVPMRAKQRTPSLSAPNWGRPAECALLSVSSVLREISESQDGGARKEEVPCQALTQDAVGTALETENA